MVRRNIIEVNVAEATQLMWTGSRERKSNRKGPEKYIVPRKAPSLPSDLLPPTRLHLPQVHHLPIVNSNYDPINS
jgi:hypothetical protein